MLVAKMGLDAYRITHLTMLVAKNGFCDAVTYSKMGFNSFGMIIIQNITTLLFPKKMNPAP